MSNIVDVMNDLKNLTFKEKMFSECEALAFAQMAYLPFEKLNLEGGEITLGEALNSILTMKEPSHSVLLFTRLQDIRMMNDIKDSIRYSNIKVRAVTCKDNEEEPCQFCAILFALDDGIKLVAYRGTIATVWAWNESINMAASKAVPSQTESLEFLQHAMDKYPGSFILTGHSKGGNLAIYSAVMAPPQYQDRILKVYNFDGPGFNDFQDINFRKEKIKDRIETFIPQSSVVGILLNHEEKIQVVKSSAASLFQHDPYTIQTENDHFVTLPGLSDIGKINELTMRDFLGVLSQSQVEEFISTVFTIFGEIGANAGLIKAATEFISALINLKGQDKKNIDKVFEIYRQAQKKAEAKIREEKREEKREEFSRQTGAILKDVEKAISDVRNFILPGKEDDKNRDVDESGYDGKSEVQNKSITGELPGNKTVNNTENATVTSENTAENPVE